jgi:hypothetical protein
MRIVSAEQIEKSETLLDELMDEIQKDPTLVIYLKKLDSDTDAVAVLVHPDNEAYSHANSNTESDSN